MELGDNEYLIATLAECPSIAAGFDAYRAAIKLYVEWSDAVLEDWKCPRPSAGLRTYTGNGFVDEVKFKGLIPHYKTAQEARDAAAAIGQGAKAEHHKSCGWFVKVPLRSAAQKHAASLAATMGLVGSDSVRDAFYHLGKAIDRKPGGLRHWFAHPGSHEHAGRVLFTLTPEMDDWRAALLEAGAKPVTIVEAAQFVQDAKSAA